MEVSIMNNKYTLPVPAPHHFSFAVRDIPDVTVEQRERVLKALHYLSLIHISEPTRPY